ncbi:MAG: hypothetical protein K0Q93_2157 [Nocardioidaceae bacterium]|nr:hypothetical protein [Nocardioidaceae bacterium]
MLNTRGHHPSVSHFAHLFDHDHLPPHLAAVSRLFHDLAQRLLDVLSDGPELVAGLRKLVEAKDCAVRQLLVDEQAREDNAHQLL